MPGVAETEGMMGWVWLQLVLAGDKLVWPLDAAHRLVCSSGVPQAPVSAAEAGCCLWSWTPAPRLLSLRMEKMVIYLSETRSRKDWRKFWIRDGLVCVCFGCSPSDLFQHILHMSGLTGGLKPSACLPAFCLTLNLQIDLFASPCLLAEHCPRLPRDRVVGVPLLQKCSCRSLEAVTNAEGEMPREGLRSWQPRPRKGSRPLRPSKEVSQACRFVGAASCVKHLFLFQKRSSGRDPQGHSCSNVFFWALYSV